jgi:hypothetical protein
MRVRQTAITALADATHATRLTSAPLIQFFNFFGNDQPVVKVLESKRQFAYGAWAKLNGTPKFEEAVNQILTSDYWLAEDVRQREVARLTEAFAPDGLTFVKRDGQYRVRSVAAETPRISHSRRPSYSLRKGRNPNQAGFKLEKIIELFLVIYGEFSERGYFTEAFGYYCVDAGDVLGTVRSPEADIVMSLRKENLWPPGKSARSYSEDDLFDMIEYLYEHVSKPLTGTMHSYSGCGMHWETFDKDDGQREFRVRINEALQLYERKFELAANGEILERAEIGLEPIIDAKLPSADDNVRGRVEAAVLHYRRHGSTMDDRRNAVRELADVLEYLRPQVKEHMKDDENDLFNIANNFGIRHHNQKQKTRYDQALWLSWIFYVYLAAIHLVVRKIEQTKTF